MVVNKVISGSEVLLDLTADTVQAGNLMQGITAHNSNGESITGSLVIKPALVIHNVLGYTSGASVDSSKLTSVGTVSGSKLIL